MADGTRRRSRPCRLCSRRGIWWWPTTRACFPARLIGRRDPSGGAVECFLLERENGTDWQALVHPGQKLKPGTHMVFEDAGRAPGVRIRAEVLERRFFGRRLVRLEC